MQRAAALSHQLKPNPDLDVSPGKRAQESQVAPGEKAGGQRVWSGTSAGEGQPEETGAAQESMAEP